MRLPTRRGPLGSERIFAAIALLSASACEPAVKPTPEGPTKQPTEAQVQALPEAPKPANTQEDATTTAAQAAAADKAKAVSAKEVPASEKAAKDAAAKKPDAGGEGKCGEGKCGEGKCG